jgi:hypothetical protein
MIDIPLWNILDGFSALSPKDIYKIVDIIIDDYCSEDEIRNILTKLNKKYKTIMKDE